MEARASIAPGSNPQQGFYQCGDCKRSYTRVDHLARHVRSHTQEKPYLCVVCSKRFSRVDLLKRHAMGHKAKLSEPATSDKRNKQPASPSFNPRVSQACEACAKVHLRCEETKPCKRCQKKQLPCMVLPRSTSEEVTAMDAAGDLLKLAQHSSIHPAPPSVEMPLENASLIESYQNAENFDVGQNEEPIFHQHVSSSLPQQSAEGCGVEDQIPDTQRRKTQISNGDILNNPDIPGLPDFLRNMNSSVADPFVSTGASNHQPGIWTPRGLMDFGLESNLELNDIDLSFLDTYNSKAPFDFESPNTEYNFTSNLPEEVSIPHNRAALRTEAFRRSIWRFIPVSQDHGAAEQQHLSLPISESSRDNPESLINLRQRITMEKLNQSTRDKILALVIGTCKTANISRAVVSFPSMELLDILLQYYLTSPYSKVNSWLHIPTFCPTARRRPELLTILIAAGAVLTPDKSLRKLGLALQEAVRVYIPMKWEEDNSQTRNLELLQANMLQLEIGLWSGNSRKIEIAESLLQPLATMLRRSGKYRYSGYTFEAPSPDDHGEVLEKKWRVWTEQQSYIRLVFYAFQHDSQTSMALLTNPIISYAELLLPLPDTRSLWMAADAETWKSIWLNRPNVPNRRLTLADCVNDVGLLSSSSCFIDIDESRMAYLYAHWGLTWEYRQLSSFLKLQTRQGLLMKSRHQDIVQTLNYFRISSEGLANDISSALTIVLEVILMHLNMSLEEVQVLAGVEGQEEAGRVYPSLRDWASTTAARQAVWHGGQVIRTIRSLPVNFIRDFHVIAVYHASLAFWAYGLIQSAEKRPFIPPVWLDDLETVNTQRFIGLDRGSPCIRGMNDSLGSASPAFLDDPSAVLDAVLEVVRANHSAKDEPRPPLVENLIQLLGGLRAVAKAPRLGYEEFSR
ncbi:hypothetical protein AOQ84DRAFT_345070 [Glonium stellatum]|uniref:Uncharacterized protein n=1 Tax=Glonium stellatum TaxID=574774 RepID=A0A8E2EV51_9PEZI|nr:hypothetical protein AOQ84DRAFT_345070 [Glonium stellatum]